MGKDYPTLVRGVINFRYPAKPFGNPTMAKRKQSRKTGAKKKSKDESNVFDKTSRYLMSRMPREFIAWCFDCSPELLVVRRLINTRSLAPDQPERVFDLVAEVTWRDTDGEYWAIDAESQTRPDFGLKYRMPRYLLDIQENIRPSDDRMTDYEIGGIIVNLTGRGKDYRPSVKQIGSRRMIFGMQPIQINLCDCNAAETVQKVGAGIWPITLLGWIPLMAGGNESGIIEQWVVLVDPITDPKMRSDLAIMAKNFAVLTNTKPLWDNALKGWMTMKSELVEELNREARIETRIETRQSDLISFVKRKLGKSNRLVTEIEAITDSDRLERMIESASEVTTLDELLAIE